MKLSSASLILAAAFEGTNGQLVSTTRRLRTLPDAVQDSPWGGEKPMSFSLSMPEEILCDGTDNRVESKNPRIGRLRGNVVCTAWLISEDVVVTAGHCVKGMTEDGEPNPPPPEGFLVEFNVPKSTEDGLLVDSASKDRYVVRFGANNNILPTKGEDWYDEDGVGNDWAVGRLLPNQGTGLKAGETMGCWFNLEYEQEPAIGDQITITGYGTNLDASVPNAVKDEFQNTQRTHAGPLLENRANDGSYVLRYAVDSTPGNSGGPVIDSAGRAVGIHTNSASGVSCTTSPPANGNLGGKITQPDLKAALESYLGVAPEDQVNSPTCPSEGSGSKSSKSVSKSGKSTKMSKGTTEAPTPKGTEVSKSGKSSKGIEWDEQMCNQCTVECFTFF